MDFMEGTNGADFLMIWMREDMELRTLKLAITAKVVWKHRLNFFFRYEDMNSKIEEPVVDALVELQKLQMEYS